MTSWITVCDTCRRAADTPEGLLSDAPPVRTDGADLAALVEAAAAGTDSVRVRRHACLMGCARACNVTIQGHGKLGYTLAGFTADAETAAALVAYAAAHADSATGQVPYRDWPQPVKGHFVSRHLPLPEA
jgi:predicted metal-binding protein